MSSLFSLSASAANVLAFDGANDLVRDSTFSPGIFAKTSFSVELWFKSDAVNRGYLVQSANSSSSSPEQKIQYSMRLEAGGSVIASYGGNGSYVTAASPSSYGDGNWHHAAMTLASSGVFTLYIDGAAVATDSYSETRGTTYSYLSLYLGVLTSTSFSNSSYFKGQMRDVRFWSDTRSAAEVLANKDATLTGAESGLFAWYTLDQGVGGGTSTTTIIDSAGSNDAEPLNFSVGGTVSNFVAFVDNTDLDASLTAAAGVAEPVAIPTSVDTVGEAVDVFDFTLADGGTADAQALGVSQLVVKVSGTATDAQRSQVTWRLNGPDASNVTGTYSAGADTLTFSGLSISVADGASEVYTVNAYFNDNTSLTDNATVILSVDGDTEPLDMSSGYSQTMR